MSGIRFKLKPFVVLAALLLAIGGLPVCLLADDATPGFGGKGLCRFDLHQYFLPKGNEAKINEVVGDLLKRHEEAFHFIASTNLHVRIHIFGTFDGYGRFALASHARFENSSYAISNIAGYFMEPEDEVVTWRQTDPTHLANNILHECSHAIMHQQFRVLPIWLDEGCAVYFSYPVNMRTAQDDLQLRYRWYMLRKWLDTDALPDLHTFLDISQAEFQRQDPAKTYPASWSIFQLLMSTPENRRALNGMIQELQKPPSKPGSKLRNCAEMLNSYYPGGLAKMAKDWRAWIAYGATNFLGPE